MLKLKLQYFGHLMPKLTHWKRPWCWERLKAGEGDDRRWDGWMASLTQWTWIWVNSGSWWWTGRPGVLQSMGSQRVGHNWATELNWKPSCPILCDPRDYSTSGTCIHGIIQARILEVVTIPFSRGSFQSRNQTRVSCIAGRFVTTWTTRGGFQTPRKERKK